MTPDSVGSSPLDEPFHTIFSSTHYLYLVLDLEGTVLEISPSMLELSGLNRGEVVGQPLWALSFWSTQACSQLQNAVAQVSGGAPEQLELVVRRSAEGLRTLACSLKTFGGGEAEPAYLLFEGHDVTRWRETETALERQRVFSQTVLDTMNSLKLTKRGHA